MYTVYHCGRQERCAAPCSSCVRRGASPWVDRLDGGGRLGSYLLYLALSKSYPWLSQPSHPQGLACQTQDVLARTRDADLNGSPGHCPGPLRIPLTACLLCPVLGGSLWESLPRVGLSVPENSPVTSFLASYCCAKAGGHLGTPCAEGKPWHPKTCPYITQGVRA